MPLPSDFAPLPSVVISKSEVGVRYHVGLGLSDGSCLFGYLLDEQSQKPFVQKSDISSRDQLVQQSSPNLTDRDLVTFPRVTDGNFSGGLNQINFIDPTKFWDGDLDIAEPGYAKLRPSWSRAVFASPQTTTMDPQITAGFGGPAGFVQKAYIAYGTVTGTGTSIIYCSDGSTITTPTAPVSIQGDPSGLYYCDATGDVYYLKTPTGSWAKIIDHTASLYPITKDFWIVDQGTGGLWLYMNALIPASVNAAQYVLARLDLSQVVNATTPTTKSPSQIPWGAEVRQVTDICGYLNGVAMLVNTPGGVQVWFHDGTYSDMLLTLPGYQSYGLCNVLGVLYLTLNSLSGYGPSLLVAITSGQMNVVAQFGRQNLLSSTKLGAAQAGEFRVYFVLQKPAPVSSVYGFVAYFDIRTGAVARDQQAISGTDNPPLTHRGLVIWGDQSFGFASRDNSNPQGSAGLTFYAKSTTALAVPGTPPAYDASVLADAPFHYYRLNPATIAGDGSTYEPDAGSSNHSARYGPTLGAGYQYPLPVGTIVYGGSGAIGISGLPSSWYPQGPVVPSTASGNYSGDVTVEFAIKMNSYLALARSGDTYPLFVWGASVGTDLTVYYLGNGTIGVYGMQQQPRQQWSAPNWVTASVAQDNNPHLVQITFDSVAQIVTIYIDGQQVTTASDPSTVWRLGVTDSSDAMAGILPAPPAGGFPNPVPTISAPTYTQGFAAGGPSSAQEGQITIQAVQVYKSRLSFSRLNTHFQAFRGPQTNTPRFTGSGYLITSRVDFNTPAINKLIRRATVNHGPLNAGESVGVSLWTDADPSNLPTAPYAITNAVQGSTETRLSLPINTQAKSVVVQVQLFGPGATTPTLNNVAIEGSTPFVWVLDLKLSHRRLDLLGSDDGSSSGVKASDLKHLLDRLWLGGQTGIFIDPDQLTWNVVVEDYEWAAKSPLQQSNNLTERDLEGMATVKLRALPG